MFTGGLRNFLPLQRANESAHNKFAVTISGFCEALDDGSPKLKSNAEGLF